MTAAKILIVEDEFIVANDIAARLVDFGYAVAGKADTGLGAIELAMTTHPDLVLMDIRIKGAMDGIQAAEEIRQRLHLPVVFLTAYAEDATLQRAKVTEPYGYILKPFEDRELRTIIEIALYKHRAEEELRRLGQMYRLLSEINQALVRVRLREELFEAVCQATAAFAGFTLVWIGWLDPDTHAVRPVAQAGDRRGYLDTIRVYVDDSPESRGPVGICLREGQSCIFNDFIHDPRALPWHEQAVAYRLGSAAAFPIRVAGQACGVYAVYAERPGAFRDQEIALLEEAANNISFALDHLDQEQKRQQTEEALRHSEERYRHLVEATYDWVWEVDAEGRYIYASSQVENLLGYTPGEVLGKTPFDFMPEEEVQRVGVIFREIVAKREVLSALENTCRHKDGSLVVLETSGVPVLAPNGEFKGYRGMDRDITERKRLQLQLMQSHKLEAIGRLAGGIAHDFRNQLTVVRGYCEMLLRLSLIKDGKENLVGEILKATHRGSQLTGQLLAFSRKDMLQPSLANLGKVLADLSEPMGRLVGEDIVISTTGGRPDCLVDIAVAQFEHALMNLVANARDAMPRGGALTLDTACVDVDEALATTLPDSKVGSYVRVTMRDHGMGMDAVTKSRLFEPFFTTKERGKGTGLGLPMVYGFVLQSGGFITVESEPGKGTSFALHFPRVLAAVNPDSPGAGLPDAQPAASISRGTETILVVEDEEPIRWLVRQCLREAGYTVIEAGDALQAIDAADAADTRIDLLITDVIMPGMSGVELATQVRERRPGIPVLFVSGYDDESLGERGVDLAGSELLTKPFDYKQLAGIVRRLLDKIPK